MLGWGLTRSKLLSSKYYTNNIIKSVAVQKIFVTYSINTEIRKCECIELNIFWTDHIMYNVDQWAEHVVSNVVVSQPPLHHPTTPFSLTLEIRDQEFSFLTF